MDSMALLETFEGITGLLLYACSSSFALWQWALQL